MSFEKLVSKFNTWVDFSRNAREVLEPWGITPASMGAAVLPTIGLVGVMIFQSVPWYIILPAVLFLISSVIHLYAGVAKARAVQGVKKLSVEAVADACQTFEERYWTFLEDHRGALQEKAELEARRRDKDPATGIDGWEQARQLEGIIMRKMKARLGSDVAALMAMFSTLEIEGDSDFRSLHWSDSQARYYGAVGKLLKRGMLEEARKLKRHDIFF